MPLNLTFKFDSLHANILMNSITYHKSVASGLKIII